MHNQPHTQEAKDKMRIGHLGKHHSPATEFKKGHPDDPKRVAALARGENHWKWQEKPSYSAVHVWINKKMGRPNVCSRCSFESTNTRRFHWANQSGKYLREVSDWVFLCVKCHFQMDRLLGRRWRNK